MRRAHELLKAMRSAVRGAVLHSFSPTTEETTLLSDGSPMPLAAVQLFSSLCDCVVNAKASDQYTKILDRRLPLVAFIHEIIASVHEQHARAGQDNLQTAAILLRMMSSFAVLVAWGFFPDSAKAVAKMPSSEFAQSLSRTTIMGMRRTSAIETVDECFMAASTRTNVLHESLNEAFNSSKGTGSSSSSSASASRAHSTIEKLASYYNEPISVPVFEDDGATSPSRGYVQLTRWFLTLCNLAEESEEALVAALLQEVDFATEHIIEHMMDHFEEQVGTAVNVTTAGSPPPATPSLLPSSTVAMVASRVQRRRVGQKPSADVDAAQRVVDLFHPLRNDLSILVDTLTELCNLVRPRALPSSTTEGEEAATATASGMHACDWQSNLVVHRLACNVCALFLERVGACVVDCLGIITLAAETKEHFEGLLLRNDMDGHFVKECVNLLERTIKDTLGLDDSCLEALLPLRELCDLLALPADCFDIEGVFYSILPKDFVRLILQGGNGIKNKAMMMNNNNNNNKDRDGGDTTTVDAAEYSSSVPLFLLNAQRDGIPPLDPREARDCSLIDLVSCGDMLHASSNSGLTVESEGELVTLKWDAADKSDVDNNGAAIKEGAAAKYRKEMEDRRVDVARTFFSVYRGIADSLATSTE